MRKLGKTFSKRYAFKRKLTTDPEINRLYKKREIAIGSIPAVRNAALFETEEPLSVHTGTDILPSDAAKIKLINKGESNWPRRIMYSEQIIDLRNANRDVWVVSIRNIEHRHYIVQIRYLDFPMIVEKSMRAASIQFVPTRESKFLTLDQHNNRVHYLAGWAELRGYGEDPFDIWSCGVCPSPHDPFNATFYDKEVATLYAESLKHEAIRQGLDVK